MSGKDAGLVMDRALLAEVLAYCRRDLPYEACGILGGAAGHVRSVYPARNAAPDRERRYLVDPEDQFRIFKAMRAADEELVAIYHSHPATGAYPSETDIDMAYYPDAFYVIVSLAQARPVVRAFLIDQGARRIEETPVTTEAGGDAD